MGKQKKTGQVIWESEFGDYLVSGSWSPDGTRLALLGGVLPIGLFDADSGEKTGEFPAHRFGNSSIAWSKPGDRIATGGQDGVIRVFNPHTLSLVFEFGAGNNWIEHLSWSDDGKILAAAHGKQLFLFSADGEPLGLPLKHDSTISGLVWKKGTHQIASSCYGGLRVGTAGDEGSFVVYPWKGALVSLAWSPDGKWLVAGSQEDTVQIWPMPYKESEMLHMTGFPGKVKHLSWHSDSKKLATNCGNDLLIWDTSGKGPAGKKPDEFHFHQAKITALAWQKIGSGVVSGDSAGMVAFWTLQSKKTPANFTLVNSGVSGLFWSPDHQRILICTESGQTVLWKIEP